MSAHVVDASCVDLPAIADLLHTLFTQEAEFTPDRDKQLRALGMLLADRSAGRMFVAKEQGTVIGVACMQFEISTALGGRAAWVEDVIVAADCRGRGVGRLLFEHLVDFAREEGLLRLSLLTDHDNRAAQAFYARFGFVRSSMMPLRLVLNAGKSGKA